MIRRDFIRVGAAGCLSLPQLLKAQKQNTAKATSVVQIYLPGGISHQDSWDYKVNGSAEYRGPFGAIKTKIDACNILGMVPRLLTHTAGIGAPLIFETFPLLDFLLP